MACPVDHSAPPDAACPVDPATRSTWADLLPKLPATSAATLSTDRETSSIPRPAGDRWEYPSEAQFFAAMARKHHEPRAADMRTIVPIHNAVNERAWGELLKWEAGRGGERCGGVKLVTFKGNPGKLSPKARWKSLLGYARPFDRHDWVVDRCGTKMRYVIDFYTGKAPADPASGAVSFFLDVRPALDSWEGVAMRAGRLWQDWFGA
ncbi:hypothetical protein HWV62_10042 [Athelia sp. TMB]|nr:hypothetical protein HWV62_10042 [Athelia sp. TMB]